MSLRKTCQASRIPPFRMQLDDIPSALKGTHPRRPAQPRLLPTMTVTSTLLMMELKGMIKQAGGMQYVLGR